MSTDPKEAPGGARTTIHKGRGTAGNPANRYAPRHSEPVDDGWWHEHTVMAPETTVSEEPCKSALSWNKSPDLGFDRSLNPYRGCEHGCIYCYARPSHAWWDMSPGIEFETRLIARTGLTARLEHELRRPGYRCQPINLAGNTDPYQPVEARRKTTREILRFLLECRHPLTLVTKSSLVMRDTDLLAALAERNLVKVYVSLTTLDDELKRRMEPRTASPSARLKTLAALNRAGIPAGVLTAPVIPGLNDHELETLLERAADSGARSAGWMLLRLPLEVAPLFDDWLRNHYPGRADHVMSLMRQCREGAVYDSRFGHRMRGSGVFATLLEQRFRKACRRFSLDGAGGGTLDCNQFRPPGIAGQGDLFD